MIVEETGQKIIIPVEGRDHNTLSSLIITFI